jgi:hypothetical protein
MSISDIVFWHSQEGVGSNRKPVWEYGSLSGPMQHLNYALLLEWWEGTEVD